MLAPIPHRAIPRGTEPAHPGATDAGRGRQKLPGATPCSGLVPADRRFPGRPGQFRFPLAPPPPARLRSAAGPALCSRLPTPSSGLPAICFPLRPPCFPLPSICSRLSSPGSGLPAACFRLSAQSSRLSAPCSWYPAPGSLLPALRSRRCCDTAPRGPRAPGPWSAPCRPRPASSGSACARSAPRAPSPPSAPWGERGTRGRGALIVLNEGRADSDQR